MDIPLSPDLEDTGFFLADWDQTVVLWPLVRDDYLAFGGFFVVLVIAN